jgi:hypothetical protein
MRWSGCVGISSGPLRRTEDSSPAAAPSNCGASSHVARTVSHLPVGRSRGHHRDCLHAVGRSRGRLDSIGQRRTMRDHFALVRARGSLRVRGFFQLRASSHVAPTVSHLPAGRSRAHHRDCPRAVGRSRGRQHSHVERRGAPFGERKDNHEQASVTSPAGRRDTRWARVRIPAPQREDRDDRLPSNDGTVRRGAQTLRRGRPFGERADSPAQARATPPAGRRDIVWARVRSPRSPKGCPRRSCYAVTSSRRSPPAVPRASFGSSRARRTCAFALLAR